MIKSDKDIFTNISVPKFTFSEIRKIPYSDKAFGSSCYLWSLDSNKNQTENYLVCDVNMENRGLLTYDYVSHQIRLSEINLLRITSFLINE